MESVTATLKVEDEAETGVPEITPLDDKESPAGSEPAEMAKLYPEPEPPEAEIELEYAAPTVAAGKELVAMEGAPDGRPEDPLTKIERDAEPEVRLESVTVTVKLADVAVRGVPEMTPADDRLSPAGRLPALTPKLYPDPEPPVAAIELE